MSSTADLQDSMKRVIQTFKASTKSVPHEQRASANSSQTNCTPYSELPGHGYVRLLGLEDHIQKPLSPNPLECILTVIRLADPENIPEYCALSYSWPDQKPTSIINCNGYPVEVRPGLIAALQQIWTDRPGCLVWVDAVCIRQDNVSERNNQVSLMAEIYEYASEVIVWLGKEEKKVLPAFQLFTQLQNDGDVAHERLSKLFHSGKSISTLNPDFELYESLEALSDLPWFNRCWTFQEFV